MDILEEKEKLINKEINVADLNCEEVELLKKEFEKDLRNKKEELNKLNEKIKAMKSKIDNWAN